MKPRNSASDKCNGNSKASHILASLTLLIASAQCLAEPRWSGDAGSLTLPPNHQPGYQPTIRFCIELDKESGRYNAHNAAQARFNRVWMNQHTAKTDSDARAELVKIAVKALYKSVYQRSASAQRFLPDQDGRIKIQRVSRYQVDYNLRANSDALRLGVDISF